MIDTDEYERINNTKGSYLSKHGVTKLIKEVKRLRERVKTEHNLKLGEEAEDMEDFKRLRELLDAIHWDAFAEDDTTLEIDREVAERIRRGD